MTAVAAPEIRIPAPLAHQRPILADPHRFKIVRAGRRFGKSRLALNASVIGHGPKRVYRGIAQGVDVVWISPDYPQSRAIWREEIRPRFSGVDGVTLNETERSLKLDGGGMLELRSAEAIDGVRGRKLGGVVIDEAAFLDLEYAWRAVIRPALADLEGWAIILSTPKLGSYFNGLCASVEQGELGAAWTQFHGSTRDNARLSRSEVDELYGEYPPDSTDAAQELDADLIDEHGKLFKKEYFHRYDSADRNAMTVNGTRYPFVELRLYVDLASSLKQTADYTAAIVAGLTMSYGGMRKVGILYVHNERLEGPAQIDLFASLLDKWKPAESKLEAVQYQSTAAQHLRVRRPGFKILASYPDKDKRTRAVPWAAAMARGEVFWPHAAPWLPVTIKQHLRFPDGQENSTRPEDHDDIVDCGSSLATDLGEMTRDFDPRKWTVAHA
jgi:predicted phage terminase large subunit-like protein